MSTDAIAVTGMAVRVPGADDLAAFWANTLAGAESVTRRTDDTGALLWARGELTRVAEFDPGFFGMSGRDAVLLDPQHRVLLECAWQALADADAVGDRAVRRTAVFAGANYSGYRELLQASDTRVSAVEFDSGVDKDFLATTIAYRLGLYGPSLSVQTACSSSLVAVHLAVQALLEFEADQALAGGVSIVLPHTPGWRFEPRGIHSADGVCRPFDAAANGTVMGDGAGVVVLRRLEDALAAGCRVYAVLRGSAVNNDGARKIGFAAPSVAGQSDVLRAALGRSELDPADVGYVETHGTGTPLGDRVEFQALLDVYGAGGPPCALGSAKGAVGHLDNASGVVGLVRAAMGLRTATLPGTVNHDVPSDDLDLGATRFTVPAAAGSWVHDGPAPRRAAVSSFGIGGTNAHVLLEEPPGTTAGDRARQTLHSAGYRSRPHWPDPAPAQAPRAAALEQPAVAYHRAVWREWDEGAQEPDRLDQPRYDRVLLLADGGEPGDLLAAVLRDRHPDLVRVNAPPQWSAPLAAGLRPVLAGHPWPAGRGLLVCSWGLADGEAARRSYDLLAGLAADWAAGHRPAGGLDVVVLVRDVHAVVADGSGDAVAAAVTGLARVLSVEHPALRVRVLDAPAAAGQELAHVARVAGTWHAEPVLVRRGRRWWYREFTPAPPPRPAAPPANGVSVVLGAGQLGTAAITALTAAGRRVVLAVRPGRAAPAGLAGVVVVECDAADPADVDALLARAASLGPVDLVVLAAGVSGDAAYTASGALAGWRTEEHFRIKVHGVRALAGAAERHGVRRVVLISSLAGVLGALSLGPYAAAAAAMDCAADHLDGARCGWLSVGWDAWRHDRAGVSAHESRMVQDGLTPAEAGAAMGELLLSDATGHLLVVKGDLADRWERFVRGPLRRVEGSQAGVAPAGDVHDVVLAAWRDCLDDPALGPDDDLVARGADSLNALDVMAVLGDRLGVAVPADLMFDTSTPRLLADRVAELAAQAGRTAVRDWGRSGPPVWCLPPVSGDADGFAPLAGLLGEHRVLAVRGVPLVDVHADEDVGDQAAGYDAALTAVDDRPPAAVVGWSYGGVVAFELAHRVHRSTGFAPPVVLLDIPAPPGSGGRGINEVPDAEIVAAVLSHRLRAAGRSTAVLGSVDGTALPDLVDRLREDGVVPPGFTAGTAARLAAGYRHRLRAAERYCPRPYPGRVTLLRAAEAEFGDSGLLDGVLVPATDDPGWGWTALAREKFTVRVLAGHHATMLTAPEVAGVAAAVRAAVRGGVERAS